MIGAFFAASITVAASISFETSLDPRTTYALVLSSATCGVAWKHYDAITLIRKDQAFNPCACTQSYKYVHYQAQVGMMRLTDWAVTMPLIAMEILLLAQEGSATSDDNHFFMESNALLLSAALAFLMILFGAAIECLVDSTGSSKASTTASTSMLISNATLFLSSCACFAGLIFMIVQASYMSHTIHLFKVVFFPTVWSLYPIVFFMEKFTPIFSEGHVDKYDGLYALLDIVSKPLLALTVVASNFSSQL